MSDADRTGDRSDSANDANGDRRAQEADRREQQKPEGPQQPPEEHGTEAWFAEEADSAEGDPAGEGARAEEADGAAAFDDPAADPEDWAFDRSADDGMPELRPVTAPTDTYRSEQVAPPPIDDRPYYTAEAPESDSRAVGAGGSAGEAGAQQPGSIHRGEAGETAAGAPEGGNRQGAGADAAGYPGSGSAGAGPGGPGEPQRGGVVGIDATGVPVAASPGAPAEGGPRRRGGTPRFAPPASGPPPGAPPGPSQRAGAPSPQQAPPPGHGGPQQAPPSGPANGRAPSPYAPPPPNTPVPYNQPPPPSGTPTTGFPASGYPAPPHASAPYGGTVRFLPPAADAPPAPPPSGRPPPQQAPRGAGEPDLNRGAHRTHWASVPFQVLLVTVVFLALPGPLLLQFGLAWVLLMTLAVACGAFAFTLLAWWNSSFGLREDHLVVHSGLIRRSSREIPLSRLQAVDVVRPLLMQVLGLAELRVELAGGDSSEIRLRYLTWNRAERLRATLLAHAAGLAGTTPEAPEWPFYRLPFGLLLGALAFRLPVLGAVMLFVLLLVAGVAVSAGAGMFEAGVLGGAVPLLLGLMRGFLGPLMRYTDFYASLSPDGLRLRYGIFQARMQTVPPGRVQAVRIVEPLLWRALGVVRVEANVAGYVGERQMDSSILLPVVPRRLGYLLIGELFGTDGSDMRMHPAGSGRVRDGAVGVDERLFVARRGRVCQVTEIVPHTRTQTIRMTAGPLSRRRGVAAVDADTPPGPIRARAVGREVSEARRVVDGMAAYGHAARRSNAGPERWATRSEAAPSAG